MVTIAHRQRGNIIQFASLGYCGSGDVACHLTYFEDAYVLSSCELRTGRELFLTLVSTTPKRLECGSLIMLRVQMTWESSHSLSFVSTGSSIINPWLRNGHRTRDPYGTDVS